MDTLEILLLMGGLTAILLAVHWANRRLDLGLNLDHWGLGWSDMGMGTPPKATDDAREELARLRARIEELEAIVAEPEYETARQFARL